MNTDKLFILILVCLPLTCGCSGTTGSRAVYAFAFNARDQTIELEGTSASAANIRRTNFRLVGISQEQKELSREVLLKLWGRASSDPSAFVISGPIRAADDSWILYVIIGEHNDGTLFKIKDVDGFILNGEAIAGEYRLRAGGYGFIVTKILQGGAPVFKVESLTTFDN